MFSEIAAGWLAAKEERVKRSTFYAYKLLVKTHLLDVFGYQTAIDEAQVQEFVMDKARAGFRRKTIKDMLNTLRTIARFGARRYGFPYYGWEIELPTDTELRRLPVLDVASHRRLLRHLLEAPDRRNIGVTIALTTGMRLGEVCGLQWEDVDLIHRTITVRRTVGMIYDDERKATSLLISVPKTRNSDREIPISRELYGALRAVRVKGAGGSVYVLGGKDEPRNPRGYRDWYGRFLDRLKIPRVRFHGLRHTFATRCVECGCDYKTLSAILGHSNVATTLNLYVHPTLEQKKRCMDKLSRRIAAF